MAKRSVGVRIAATGIGSEVVLHDNVISGCDEGAWLSGVQHTHVRGNTIVGPRQAGLEQFRKVWSVPVEVSDEELARAAELANRDTNSLEEFAKSGNRFGEWLRGQKATDWVRLVLDFASLSRVL